MLETKTIKQLLEDERQLLNRFFDAIQSEQIEKLVEILAACQGVIILSGIGKSGLVAEKIALTLTSTGTRSFFLSPINALHGDIGIVTDKDTFILISKSGESDELLNLIPALRNKGAHLIAWTSNPDSRLVKACDMHIDIPYERELCPFDLAPTISTTSQMIVGDVVTVALMLHKQFSLSEYALNHPSGRIGRRITFKVRDLMITESSLPLCHPSDALESLLVELSRKKCGCILVVDEEKTLLGIFTDGDLRRALEQHGSKALSITIDHLMTTSPRFVGPDEMATQALAVMEADQKHPITVLPVLDTSRKVLGLIKMHDIVQSGL